MSNNSRGRGGFGGRPRGGQRGGWRGATRGGGRAKELHEDLGRVNLNDQTTSGQGIVSKPTSGKETEQIQTEGDVSLLLLLPPELLKLICEKCDEKGLLHLERTCRQLRALVRQCRAWQKHCVARNWQLYDYTLNQFANSSQGWSDRHKYGAVILEVEHSRVDDIPWVKFREPGLMPRLHITDKHLYVTHGREVRFTNQRPRPYIPFHALGPGGGGGRGRIGHGFWKGHLLKDLPNHFTEPYDDIADFCVDGDRLVTAGADSRLRLWSLKAKRVVRELIGHLGIVHTVGFVGDVAVSGSRDRTLRMWDLNAGGCKQVIEMQDRVWCVSVGKGLPHPGMALCGTSGHRGSPLLLMDLEACTALTHFKGHSGGVSSIRPIPHKSVFLSCGYDSACRLYDVRSPQWCAEFADIDGTPVTCVDTDNIGCVITGTARYGVIRHWDMRKSSMPVHTIYVGGASTLSQVFSLKLAQAGSLRTCYVALATGVHVVTLV